MSQKLSPQSARLLAAGLWVFGAGLLAVLAFRLDAAGVILLVLGVFNVVLANWIKSVVGPAQPDGTAESPDAATRAPGEGLSRAERGAAADRPRE